MDTRRAWQAIQRGVIMNAFKGGNSYSNYFNINYRDTRDLTGEQFGSWKVVSKNPKKALWLCQCVCGTMIEKSTFILVNLKSSQCVKCHRREMRNRKEARCAFQKENGLMSSDVDNKLDGSR